MTSRTVRLRRTAAGSLVAATLLAGCSTSTPSSGPAPTGSPTAPQSSPSVGPPSQTASTPPADCAERTLARLTRRERVGQLVMLGLDAGGDPSAAVRIVGEQHLGSVTLIGRSYEGVAAVRRTTDQLQEAADLPLLVATDQEGGQVQVLHGPGFTEMPSALDQGRLPAATLRRDATAWGKELDQAGVTTDLAPVLDVVPASLGTANQPIGRYHRQYGSTAAQVSSHGLAFAQGMQAAGVLPVVKHFPGLGAVRGNTDVTARVVDTVTGPTSPSLQPFRDAVEAGAPVVMVSSAVYDRIDPSRPAMFSRAVVTDLLREDLGFQGVALTDDIGQAAAARAYGSVARRAVDVVSAGGDVLLTVRSEDVPEIVSALLDHAADHVGFARRIDQSVLRVLELKQSAGLLTC